jgi:hypothetical protein
MRAGTERVGGHCRPLAVALLLAAAGCGSGTAASAPAGSPGLPDGITAVAVPPYRVLGDEPADVVEARARGSVEQPAALLRSTLFEREPAPTLDVWLFRDGASMAHHAEELFAHRPDTPEGFYAVAEHAIVVDVSTGDGAPVHFLSHAFMAANHPTCPVWFDEGLAALYEVWRERQGRIAGEIDAQLPWLQQEIRAGELPSLEALTALDRAGFHGPARATNRRMARYLCYHLQQQQQLREFFDQLRGADPRDPGGHEVLLRVAGGDDPAGFEARWQQWILALSAGG